jgi:flagellar protein FliL
VQILTREPETVEVLKANDPVVRDNLLMLFSGQKYEVVAQPEGKEKLRMEALKTIKHVVEANGGKPDSIENVYFTSFVMQ